MYGKHFQSMYTGSMYGAGADVFAVWGYIIAHTVESQVEINPDYLAPILGMTSERITSVLEYLLMPDPKSRNTDEDGRRLLKEGQFTYHVVTHSIYHNLRNAEEKRRNDRERQRKHRALPQQSQVSRNVTQQSQTSQNVAHTETETETETNTHAQESNSLYEQRIVTGGYAAVTEPYKGVQTRERTAVDIAALRNIGFRRSSSVVVEHEFAAVLEAGADPKEVIKSCQRIYEWTEKGKYARDLADTIRRWQEPQHLWVRTEENGKRRKSIAEVIRDTRTDPDA